MNKPWDAEFKISISTIELLLATQFHQLERSFIQLLDRGWDNEVWRVGDNAFRFPRRRVGASLVQTEAKVLPKLAKLLPQPIPAPKWLGSPSSRFPHHFLGYPYLTGKTADRTAPSTDQRKQIAVQLAQFLQQLHAIPQTTAEALGVPPDTFRTDLQKRRDDSNHQLELLDDKISETLFKRSKQYLNADHDWGRSEARSIVHGDLYARHLLLDESCQLCGVINWGDLCLSDPALDLSIVYTFFPPEVRPTFWAHYGEVDRQTQERARFFGFCRHGIQLFVYAVDIHDKPLLKAAKQALTWSLAVEERVV